MAVVCRTFRGEHLSPGLKCEDKSLAVQASKDECDINTIVKKYLRTGELPGIRQVVYADISGLTDLQDALNTVIKAEEGFAALPAETRRFFDNDPVKLVEFAQDPANKEKAIELGLVDKPAPVLDKPMAVAAASPAAAPTT